MVFKENVTSGNPFYDVVVMEDPPFVIAHKGEPGSKTTFSGISIELLKAVSKIANFDYSVILVDHQSYGYRNQNGEWKGLISEIKAGTAQIAVGAIPRETKEDGDNIVDFTSPYMNSKLNLLVKSPPDETRGIGLMFEPFKAEVWVMLCLAFIAVSLALFLIGRFSPYEWARLAKDKEFRNNRKIFELKNSFFFVASTISLQGYKEAPRSMAGRFLSCIWFMFVMCVLLAYTAALGSILVTRCNTPSGLPFSSYEDLIDQNHIKLGALKNGNVYSALRTSTLINDGLRSKIFSYIDNKQEWITDPKEGVQRVQDWDGKYAMVMENVKASYIAKSHCDLMAYGESISHLSYCFAVFKNSPVKERIDLGISILIKNNFMSQLEKKYLSEGDCPVRDTVKIASLSGRPYLPLKAASSLDMRDMAVPFIVLFLGVFGAGAVMAGEIYYRKEMAVKKTPQEVKEREPLNAETTIIKAPRVSPPPPPIYKVNNKLQEEKQFNKTDYPEKGNSSIEVVIVNEKEKLEEDYKNDETEKVKDVEEVVDIPVENVKNDN